MGMVHVVEVKAAPATGFVYECSCFHLFLATVLVIYSENMGHMAQALDLALQGAPNPWPMFISEHGPGVFKKEGF